MRIQPQHRIDHDSVLVVREWVFWIVTWWAIETGPHNDCFDSGCVVTVTDMRPIRDTQCDSSMRAALVRAAHNVPSLDQLSAAGRPGRNSPRPLYIRLLLKSLPGEDVRAGATGLEV